MRCERRHARRRSTFQSVRVVGAIDQTAASGDGPSCAENSGSPSAQVAGLGGLVGGENHGSSRYLSARVARRFEARTGRRGLPDDDLQRLPGARAIAKKKTQIASEQERPDVAQKRPEWRASQEQIDPAKVVFIDETWAKTNMTRTYGRSPLGTRLVEKTPYGRWETTTFLGALRAHGFVAPLTIEGTLKAPRNVV